MSTTLVSEFFQEGLRDSFVRKFRSYFDICTKNNNKPEKTSKKPKEQNQKSKKKLSKFINDNRYGI